MKNLLMLFLMVFVLSSVVSAEELMIDYNEHICVENVDEVVHEYDYVIIVDLVNDMTMAGCTVKGSVTITTEDGDSVSVSFEVTASTCKEAGRVLAKLTEALDQ